MMLSQKRSIHSPGRRNIFPKLSKQEIQAILDQHRLGLLQKISLLSNHPQFSIYQIDTETNSFIGYLYHKKDPLYTDFVEEVFSFLQTKNLPIPEKIASSELFSGKFMLWNRCVGKPSCHWNTKQCFSLGTKTALLHTYGRAFRSKSLKPPLLIQFKTRLCRQIPKMPNGFETILDELEDLEKSWPTSLPHGLIHSDLWEKNILFTKDTVSAFLDPHAYQVDLFIFDIASVIKQIFFSHPIKNADLLFDHFLEGYNCIRPILPEEYDAITLTLRLKILLTTLNMLEKASLEPLKRTMYLNHAMLNFMKLYEAKSISFTKCSIRSKSEIGC